MSYSAGFVLGGLVAGKFRQASAVHGRAVAAARGGATPEERTRGRRGGRRRRPTGCEKRRRFWNKNTRSMDGRHFSQIQVRRPTILFALGLPSSGWQVSGFTGALLPSGHSEATRRTTTSMPRRFAAVAGAAARARTDADLVTAAEVRADVERWEHRAFGRKYLQEELIRQNASAAGAGGGDGGHRVAIWGVSSGKSARNSNRDHCSQSQVHRSVPLCDSGFALIGVAGFWACLKGLFCHPNPPRQRLRGDELRRWRARRGGGEGSEAT